MTPYVRRIQDVEKILNTGGFRIKDWHCSSKELQVTLNERSIQFPRCLQPHRSTAPQNCMFLLMLVSSRMEQQPTSFGPPTVERKYSSGTYGSPVASRLAKTICDEFKIKPTQVILWSDSMIVLAWLRSESTMFRSFVGVRIAEIQASFETTTWRYVPSNLNPAEDLSRGITVDEMKR